MANRIFVGVVILLWLFSMGWLVFEKILPSFNDGQPPSTDGYETDKHVAWKVEWSGRLVGHAASVRREGVAGTSEIHNQVYLEDVPVLDLAPAWMKGLLEDIGHLQFDAKTRLEFDSLHNFSAFDSRISINDLESVIRMSGRVEDSYLKLKVQSGDLGYSPSVFMSNKDALSEALFPNSKLRNLFIGRTWTEEVYSPFRSPSTPVELIEATVEGVETMPFEGKHVRSLKVVYRGLPGSGVSEQSRLRAECWVAMDGLVLQRDVYVGSSKLRFIRLSDHEALKIGEEVFSRRSRQVHAPYPTRSSKEPTASELSRL